MVGYAWDLLGGDAYEVRSKKIGDDWFVIDFRLRTVS
jgi:hypothetical protein